MKSFIGFEIENFNAAYNKGMSFFKMCMADTDIANADRLKLAYEEMFVNVIIANTNRKAEVSFTIEIKNDRIEVCMKDNGIRFDPIEKPDPDITLSADERPVGGLGIYIFKKAVDYFSYEFKDGFNTLTYGIYTGEHND